MRKAQSRLVWLLAGGLILGVGGWVWIDGASLNQGRKHDSLAGPETLKNRLAGKRGEIPSLFPPEPVEELLESEVPETDAALVELEVDAELEAPWEEGPLAPQLRDDQELTAGWEEGRMPRELEEELEESVALLGGVSAELGRMALQQAAAMQNAWEIYAENEEEIPMPSDEEIARMRWEADNQPGPEEKARLWRERGLDRAGRR